MTMAAMLALHTPSTLMSASHHQCKLAIREQDYALQEMQNHCPEFNTMLCSPPHKCRAHIIYPNICPPPQHSFGCEVWKISYHAITPGQEASLGLSVSCSQPVHVYPDCLLGTGSVACTLDSSRHKIMASQKPLNKVHLFNKINNILPWDFMKAILTSFVHFLSFISLLKKWSQ